MSQVFFFFFLIYSGFRENFLRPSPMQLSHVITRWCMPALWMEVWPFFML
jgi:hypothetical protein